MRARALLVLLLCVCASGLAFAASTTGEPTTPAGGGLLIGLAIAYLARRRAIGGWLLYYYMQLYGSFLLALILSFGTLKYLNPTVWDNSLRYVLYFLSVTPALVTQIFEVFAGTRLLMRRKASNVRLLQAALVAMLITSGAALVIDASYFSDSTSAFFDTLTLGFSIIWLIYFRRSRRVRAVFIEHAWNYATLSPPRVLTPLERKYLAKRTAIASLITFVLMLLLMGSTLGDKKPDARIFAVPLFYALIAALIGWYAPVRKKKRDVLLNRSDETVSTKTD